MPVRCPSQHQTRIPVTLSLPKRDSSLRPLSDTNECHGPHCSTCSVPKTSMLDPTPTWNYHSQGHTCFESSPTMLDPAPTIVPRATRDPSRCSRCWIRHQRLSSPLKVLRSDDIDARSGTNDRFPGLHTSFELVALNAHSDTNTGLCPRAKVH